MPAPLKRGTTSPNHMKSSFFFFSVLAFTLLSSFTFAQGQKAKILGLTKTPDPDSEPGSLIQLPLRVHLVTNVELQQKGTTMDMWIKPQDFQKKILPEINRIWKPANIQWVLESLVIQPAPDLPNKKELTTFIQNSKRLPSGKSDPKRSLAVLQLCNRARSHPAIHNLYFFPYLGKTYQGFAGLKGNYAVVTTWTDKPFRARKPPIKFPFTEELPFKIGSIARTCSHELGHNLALQHPDKTTQTRFNRLMGGKKHGYTLVPEEIELARKTALERAKLIRKWAEQ